MSANSKIPAFTEWMRATLPDGMSLLDAVEQVSGFIAIYVPHRDHWDLATTVMRRDSGTLGDIPVALAGHYDTDDVVVVAPTQFEVRKVDRVEQLADVDYSTAPEGIRMGFAIYHAHRDGCDVWTWFVDAGPGPGELVAQPHVQHPPPMQRLLASRRNN